MMPKKIIRFDGQYSFLSNFSPAVFVWDDITWANSEAAYQAAKSLDREVRLAFAELTDPVAAKRGGKRIALRPDWNEVKFDIMYDIVYEKFHQNPILAKKLLQTKDAILEEGNHWGDKIWGVCPAGSGNGQNWLGKILMAVREDLQK